MGTGSAYQNLGILRYSRRHIIGDLRRPASATNHSQAASLWLVEQE